MKRNVSLLYFPFSIFSSTDAKTLHTLQTWFERSFEQNLRKVVKKNENLCYLMSSNGEIESARLGVILSPYEGRLMTMSPLYPCGKPCSRGTHNEKLKNLALFSSIINGIMKESRLRFSIPWKCFQLFNRIEHSITFTP